MAKKTYVKVAGAWKEVKNVWIKVGGVWKQKVIPKIRVGEVWKDAIQYLLNLYNEGSTTFTYTLSRATLNTNHIKVGPSGGSSSAMGAVLSNQLVNLTDYTKLKFEVTSYTTNGGNAFGVTNTTGLGFEYTSNYTVVVSQNHSAVPLGVRRTVEVNVAALSGGYYLKSTFGWPSGASGYMEIHKIWLE